MNINKTLKSMATQVGEMLCVSPTTGNRLGIWTVSPNGAIGLGAQDGSEFWILESILHESSEIEVKGLATRDWFSKVEKLDQVCKQRDKLVDLIQSFLSQTRMGVLGKGLFVKVEEFDELGIALAAVKHGEIIPPLDCAYEELVAYIKSMKGGERVMEMGESGLKGCTGRVVIIDGATCIRWDRWPGDMGVMTSGFTVGARVIPEMTEEEWLDRCAARFMQRAQVDEEIARDMAKTQLEYLGNDLTENPEDAADEEMNNWTSN